MNVRANHCCWHLLRDQQHPKRLGMAHPILAADLPFTPPNKLRLVRERHKLMEDWAAREIECKLTLIVFSQRAHVGWFLET